MTLVVSACGGGSSDGSSTALQAPTGSDRHYAGPGSRWDVRLNGDFTFSIERRATANTPVVLTVTGTYQELDSGFLQLVVSTAQGEDAPDAGQTAWAIEVPGYALFLKPDESPFGGFISMIEGGSCPEEDFSANWTVVRPALSSTADSSTVAHLGGFTYLSASQEVTIERRHSLTAIDGDLGEVDLGEGVCTDGVIATEHAMIYLTAAGGALIHTNHPEKPKLRLTFFGFFPKNQ